MSHFSFDPLMFVQAGYEKEVGEWSDTTLVQLKQLAVDHPELSSWGTFPIGMAWGSYSQDILAVGWVDWINGRDTGFLAYLYINQLVPGFDFGGTGLFSDEVEVLGATAPWSNNANFIPSWAGGRGSNAKPS